MGRIDADALQSLILKQGELAILDPREEGTYSVSPHLFHSVNAPLSRLEIRLAALLPRKKTHIVVSSDDDLGQRAAHRLTALGYSHVDMLDGGIGAWRTAGYQVFTGFNTPSKAFGEFIEHECATPSISPEELAGWIAEGRDIVIVDSRTPEEHHRGTIPGSSSTPGAELALRVTDFAPNPATTVVVNCAGRTRSIIGAQSLINAGVPNKVVALRNGTMGWKLAGFEIETGSSRRAPPPSASAIVRANEVAGKILERFNVSEISWATVEQWLSPAAEQTCYLFDVRLRDEFITAHPCGAGYAQGGQLIQATDTYVAIRNARIVLYDDMTIRAAMTASWLRQMGYRNVHVLDFADKAIPLVSGPVALQVLGMPDAPPPSISAEELQQSGSDVAIIDLGAGKDYSARHILGAWWAVRSRMAVCLAKVPPSPITVLTSGDGVLATLAWQEASKLREGDVRVLSGGTQAWIDAGLPLKKGEERLTTEIDDAFVKPFEAKDREASMQAYLEWEVGLIESVRRDPSIVFSLNPA